MQNEIAGRLYRELRCPNCHMLICREYIFSGYIEFKCGRCGEQTTFRFKHNANAIMGLGEKPPGMVEAPAIKEDNIHG